MPMRHVRFNREGDAKGLCLGWARASQQTEDNKQTLTVVKAASTLRGPLSALMHT